MKLALAEPSGAVMFTASSGCNPVNLGTSQPVKPPQILTSVPLSASAALLPRAAATSTPARARVFKPAMEVVKDSEDKEIQGGLDAQHARRFYCAYAVP